MTNNRLEPKQGRFTALLVSRNGQVTSDQTILTRRKTERDILESLNRHLCYLQSQYTVVEFSFDAE